jgi:hypothetical protein
MFGKTHTLRQVATGLALAASLGAAQPALADDLRSPDARDAAVRVHVGSQFIPFQTDFPKPDPIIAHPTGGVAPATPSPVSVDDGFDWGTAGIGAAMGVGLIGLLAGVALGARRVVA